MVVVIGLHARALTGDVLPDNAVPFGLKAALLEPHASVRPPMSCTANCMLFRKLVAEAALAKFRKNDADWPS